MWKSHKTCTSHLFYGGVDFKIISWVCSCMFQLNDSVMIQILIRVLSRLQFFFKETFRIELLQRSLILHIVIMWSLFLASLYFSSLPTPEGTNKMSGTATMKNMEKLCSQKKSFFFLSFFFLFCNVIQLDAALHFLFFFIFTCFWISIRKHHRGNLNYSNLHWCLFTAYIIWYLNIKLAQQKTLN